MSGGHPSSNVFVSWTLQWCYLSIIKSQSLANQLFVQTLPTKKLPKKESTADTLMVNSFKKGQECGNQTPIRHILVLKQSFQQISYENTYSIEFQNFITITCYRKCFTERSQLTHWGRVMHVCVSNLTIIVSDNGLSPGRCQAIIWTNARMLLIGPLGTNLNEILLQIHIFSFKKIHFKMSSGKWRPFCLGLNVLRSCCPSLLIFFFLTEHHTLYRDTCPNKKNDSNNNGIKIKNTTNHFMYKIIFKKYLKCNNRDIISIHFTTGMSH